MTASGLRDYQSRALDEIESRHAAAHDPLTRRVCCVIPTGGGKSVVGREWARRRLADTGRGLVLAHRIELLTQFQSHLSAVGVRAGIIAPGHPYDPSAPVQCASLDTLSSRGEVPHADWVILDEAHHALADTYRPVIEAQPNALTLGLTATPQRLDGRPLGDVFGSLVVGAQYGELIRAGHLVNCRVFRPERFLGSDQARDPVEAWLEHARGRRGFVFCRSVKDAETLAGRLRDAGEKAVNIDGKLSARTRAERMAQFADGTVNILVNVFVLTEGVDVPSAEAIMLARAATHAGTYLQMVGRVLRPSPGKDRAIFIDLPGCSHEHGIPTADREYALEGRAIKTTGVSVRNCPQCGYTQPSVIKTCESCAFVFPRREYKGPRIWNLELLEYFENVGEFATAPKSLKRAEWDRLLDVCRSRGFGLSFAVSEYEKVFTERPGDAWLKEIGEGERVVELKRLLQIQQSRGLKLGFISQRYRETFGAFPSRALRETAGVPLPAQEWGGR